MIKIFLFSISFFVLSTETTTRLPTSATRIFGVSAHFSCKNQTTLANENTVKVFLSMDGNLTDESFGASWCPSWSGHLELDAVVENEEEFQPHLVAYHRCHKHHETGGRCRRTVIKMDKNYKFQKGNGSFVEVNLLDPINTVIVTDKTEKTRCQPNNDIYLPRGFGASDNFPVCSPGVHGNIQMLYED